MRLHMKHAKTDWRRLDRYQISSILRKTLMSWNAGKYSLTLQKIP